MRICGKRASTFTQGNLKKMLKTGLDPEGNVLNSGQLREIKKTYNMRKEVKQYAGYQE